MEDITKISQKIIDDALLGAQKIIDDANIKAEEEIAVISKKKIQTIDAMNIECKSIVDSINAKTSYDIETKRKNQLSKTKITFLDSVVLEAYKKIISSNQDYLALLKSLFEKLSHKDEIGEICFGEENKDIITDEFFKSLNDLSPIKKGESIKGHGFVIKYNGIVENAIIEQMFEENRNEYLHVLNKSLRSFA